MWLLLAFLAVPLIEIALFIQVGGLIGLWPTLGIVVLTAIAGTALVRSQGLAQLNLLRTSFSDLRDPTEPLAHGAMILFAGALLLTPGFFTDAVGLALLAPPVRNAVLRYIRARIKVDSFTYGVPPRREGPDIVEGEWGHPGSMVEGRDMADNENGAASATQPQLKMNVLGQYIRDLSFENVVVSKGIQGELQPEIQVQVSLDGKKRTTENQYEVISKYVVTSKNKANGDTLFLLELEYGGVFLIEGVPENQLHPFLMIECPRMLFPFARRIISDVTRDGGFPPVNVDNIDFVSMYRQQLLARQAQQVPAGQPVS